MTDPLPAMTVETLWGCLNTTRIQRGISWRTLSKEAGVAPSTVSRMPLKSPNMQSFLRLIRWLSDHGEYGAGCEHDGAIMVGGIGTMKNPPIPRWVCLNCGRDVTPVLMEEHFYANH